jgi:hypothetical protein
MARVRDTCRVGYVSILRLSPMPSTETNEKQWMNCEVKIFTFETDEDDEDAKMVEAAAEGKVPRDATDAPTTEEMTS